MSDARYAGSCHCGKVTYQVDIDLAHLITCNCSMCSRTGSIMAFVASSNFELVSGDADLHDYQFNKNGSITCSAPIAAFARLHAAATARGTR